MKGLAVFVGLTLFAFTACTGMITAADMMEGVNTAALGMAEKSNDCMYKLSRGVANVALGWAEIPKMCMTTDGPGVGIQRAATRTGGGVMDILTFPMTSEDEKNYIEPDFFSP